MPVQSIDSLGYTAPSLYASSRNDAVSKMDFLKLLVTQLQQQDPLNPQDPSEFTSQLAQFSSLEQMMAVNESVQALQLLQISTNNTLAASFIGKNVLFEGNQVQWTGGSLPMLYYNSPQAASDVSITIRDANNQVVRVIQAGSAKVGENSILWDGKNDQGGAAPAGTYTMTVTGKSASGDTIAMAPMQLGHVTSIVFRDGQTFVKAGGVEIALSEILSIHEAPAAAAAAIPAAA